MIPARALLVLVSLIGASLGSASRLGASPRLADPADAVITRGTGPAVVLLNGLLGGAARLAPLADRLVSQGHRVVLVDVYRVSVAAPDVSFHGMAQELAMVLRREGVGDAVVVAHAHAAGIAVRLAANAPELVSELLLLDAGVLTATHSSGITRAMRIASVVARFPGGPSLIHSRLSSGIRANSGTHAWLTDRVARLYTDPLLAELPTVATMVTRLASAREPEPVERVLTRVRAKVTVMVGAAPHAVGATHEELTLVRRIPGTRVREVSGVGHFVHEEAPDDVVGEVLAARARRVATAEQRLSVSAPAARASPNPLPSSTTARSSPRD